MKLPKLKPLIIPLISVYRRDNVCSFHQRFTCIRTGWYIRRSSSSLRCVSTIEDNVQDPITFEQGAEQCETLETKAKRIVFLGTPEVAATTLRKLHQDSMNKTKNNYEKYKIVCVITQPPKRRRRKGSKAEPSPVGRAAKELGILVLSPEKAKDPDFLDILERDIQPDLCITAAYGQYLPKRFLATPTLRTINIHPSLLPRWRGASPVQRSLEAGDSPLGVTVLYTVSKMDAGPIIAQKEDIVEDVNADDATATNVLPRLFEIGTDLLIENMSDILSGGMSFEKAKPQDDDLVVQAAMIDSAEAEMKPWEETAATLHNRLRGFSMWPGSFIYLEVGEGSAPVKFKILETRLLEGQIEDEPTDVIARGPSKKDGLRLICFDGSILEINRLQPATKKPVDALSFINGLQGRIVRYVRAIEDK